MSLSFVTDFPRFFLQHENAMKKVSSLVHHQCTHQVRIAGRWLGLLVALSQVTAAQTGGLHGQPILRVEAGMHSGIIWSISVDRAGKFLATASLDKTARVWELATGRLLRVMRMPVGEGDEGKLYAVAISPDAKTVALGGRTSDGPSKCVYLFDRESGRLVRRLTGLPEVVLHLVFSPDGALLAATLGGGKGVRVWRTSDWSEGGRDTAYGDDSYGADFDRAGRLVTSCFDNIVRLYDRGMRLLAKQAALARAPYAVRFSPD